MSCTAPKDNSFPIRAERDGFNPYLAEKENNDIIYKFNLITEDLDMHGRSMKKTIVSCLPVILLICVICAALPLTAFAENSADSGIINGEELDRWMVNYLAEHGITNSWQDFSVGFCYTGTGDCWFYNADVWMYSASLYKVPVSMLMAELEAGGELTQDSIVLGTTLAYLESTALIYSNNDSGHAMVDYLGGTYNGKCSDLTEKYTDLPADYFSQDFLDVSYYTARYMTQVMKTLYDGGEEAFPHVLEYLLAAQPDGYYNLDSGLKNSYAIAQKYGAYEEANGKNNNHCAAIIYTPTPIVVVVMTRNVGEFQKRIAEVGAWLAEYSLTLDEKMPAQQAQETAAPEESPAPPEETADPAAETAGPGEESAASDTGKTESEQPADAVPAGNKTRSGTGIPVIFAAVPAGVLVCILLLFRKRGKKKRPEKKPGQGTGTEAAAEREENTYRPRH